jgi:hypothetical protein
MHAKMLCCCVRVSQTLFYAFFPFRVFGNFINLSINMNDSARFVVRKKREQKKKESAKSWLLCATCGCVVVCRLREIEIGNSTLSLGMFSLPTLQLRSSP